MCGERGNRKKESSLRSVQILCDRTVTTLKSTSLVAYSVHIILLSVSLWKRQWLIDNGHEMVGFLPMCCSEHEVKKEESAVGDNTLAYKFTSSTTMPLERGAHITWDLERREKLMTVFHKSMEIVVRPLQ